MIEIEETTGTNIIAIDNNIVKNVKTVKNVNEYLWTNGYIMVFEHDINDHKIYDLWKWK